MTTAKLSVTLQRKQAPMHLIGSKLKPRSSTIWPILLDEQPIERRRDTTYYNSQTKEKENRIRGTIGGDRVHYPGPTNARTAAMPLINDSISSIGQKQMAYLRHHRLLSQHATPQTRIPSDLLQVSAARSRRNA